MRLESEPAPASPQGSIRLRVRVDDLPTSSSADPRDVWLAVTEDHLVSEISSGENAGRQTAMYSAPPASGEPYWTQSPLLTTNAWPARTE